jgi:uncharacterized protein (TIGR03382 family)
MKAALLFALVAACATEHPATPDASPDAAAVKVACDGALCDTTNNSTCSAGAPSGLLWIALPLAALVVRRRRR